MIWSGEDDAADTLVPRLLAMGADLSRIHFVGPVTIPRPSGDGYAVLAFDPARDIDALAAALVSVSDTRLMVVDPIVSAVAGDSHKNSETRRGLQPLADLAQARRCALLGVTHFTKGTAGRDPLDRITGSLAFGAMARVVLVAAQEQAEGDQPGRRLMMRCKSNIGPDDGGFAYELRQNELAGHPGLVASSVLWAGAVEGNARDLLADAEQQDGDTGSDAADFLRDLLADGPKPVKDVFKESDGAGYSRDQMKRALRRIGGQSRKQGLSGGWKWSLAEGSGREQTKNSAPFQPFEESSAPFEGSAKKPEGSEGSAKKLLRSSAEDAVTL